MENASKALIMAGGVLIGILIISLGVYLFADFGGKAAQVNERNYEQQIVQYNSRFTSYENKKGLTIYDVITVAKMAKENNKNYDDEEGKVIGVEIRKGGSRDILVDSSKSNIPDQKYIESDIKEIQSKEKSDLPNYDCKVEYYGNGQVKSVIFSR